MLFEKPTAHPEGNDYEGEYKQAKHTRGNGRPIAPLSPTQTKRAANARLTAVEVVGRLQVFLFKSRVPSKVRETAVLGIASRAGSVMAQR